MIIDILLIISGIAMFVSLICSNIELTVLILFIAFFLTTFRKDDDENNYFNDKKSKKGLKTNSFEDIRCLHVKTDCEECISQRTCTMQNDSMVTVKEEE